MDIFSKDGGRDAFFRLLKDADILIENLRGGSFAKQVVTDGVLWWITPPKLVIIHVSYPHISGNTPLTFSDSYPVDDFFLDVHMNPLHFVYSSPFSFLGEIVPQW